MLGDKDIMPTVAVKDIKKAKEFYQETLGLKLHKEDEAGVTFKSGNCVLYVYESPSAGTNQATYAGWVVKDVKAAAVELKEKGVSFEHYDGLGELDGDVHTMGPFKAAWFKDPSGNILVIEEM